MHPDERPSSVAELRTELLAPSPIGRAVGRLLDSEQPVAQFVRVNRGLLALIGILLLSATLITARPLTMPQAPTETPTVTATMPAPIPTVMAEPSIPAATVTPRPKPTQVPTATLTPQPTLRLAPRLD